MKTLIKNVKIIDGVLTPMYDGYILIEDEKISDIGKIDAGPSCENEIDGGGLYAAPGFIDVHTHVDFGFFEEKFLTPLLSQGCTTAIAGNCGLGLYPYNPLIRRLYDKISNFMGKLDIEEFNGIEEYLQWVNKLPKKINIGSLVPHGNIHIMVVGESTRQPTEEELLKMQTLLEECLDKGFFGLSMGLIYPPGSYLEQDSPELYKLGESLAKHNGVLCTHVRDELAHVIEATEEILKIGLETKCSTEISHIKIANKFKWGQSKELRDLIEFYVQRGANVHCDVYPYNSAGNMLATTILPPEFLMEQEDKIHDYLETPEAKEKSVNFLRDKMEEIVKNLGGIPKVLFEIIPKKFAVNTVLKILSKSIIILSAQDEPSLTGKTLYQISRERKQKVLDAAFDIIIKNKCQVSIAPSVMDWQDIDRFIKYPRSMIGSDLLIIPGLKAHPRAYGAFTAFLRIYVREKHIFSWEEAIKKMTSLPAQKFNISSRGVLKPGNYADVVLFDPNTVSDSALMTDSEQFSVGIEKVFVNGKLAYNAGKVNEENHGKYILKKS